MLRAVCCSPACTPVHYSEQAQMWWLVTLTSFACTQSSCMFRLLLCIIQKFTTANMRYAGLPRRRLMSMRDLGNRGTPDDLSDYQVIQPHRSALFLPLTRLQFHEMALPGGSDLASSDGRYALALASALHIHVVPPKGRMLSRTGVQTMRSAGVAINSRKNS